MDRLPTEQEWLDWQDHPATKAQRQVLRQWVDELKDRWASGSFSSPHEHETMILNAKAIGNCEVIEKVIDLDYDQLVGEIDGKYVGTSPSGAGSAG